MRVRSVGPLASAVVALACSTAAQAATKTATFRVSATVQSECTIVATDLNFGTIGIVSSNVDALSSITITCTSGTTYNIALDEGTVSGSSIADRKMGSGANMLAFQLYKDATRAEIWGETPATDTLGGTGTGSPQTLTVYGRVAPQVAPAVGVYETQITATIVY